jgi:myo-inositol-1-phosphate synthase
MAVKGTEIAEARGKLGVLLAGLGAVSSTFIAGVELIKKGIGKPIGSLTQLGTIRLGKRTEKRTPPIRDFVPLATLDDLTFGAWDIFPDNAYEAALRARVIETDLLNLVRPELEAIAPSPGVFAPEYVKRLHGTHVKHGANKFDLAQQLIADIETFRAATARTVMVWCGSTESFLEAGAVHSSLARFEQGLRNNDPAIAPSMIYAYASLSLGIPFANGAPNLTVDIPALTELAERTRVVEGPYARAHRLVLNQHPRQSRWRSAGRTVLLQNKGGKQAVGARRHSAEGFVSGVVPGLPASSEHSLLPTARRQ